MKCRADGNASVEIAEQPQAEEARCDKPERIPCPVDPSHTIYKHNLSVHVKKCNRKKQAQELDQQQYYCLDCNARGDSDLISEEVKLTLSVDSQVSSAALLKKVRECYDRLVRRHIEYSVSTVDADSALDTKLLKILSGDQTAKKRVRHAEQDIHLVHEMVDYELIKNSSVCRKEQNYDTDYATFVELGAGKGLLGMAVVSAATHSPTDDADSAAKAQSIEDHQENDRATVSLVMIERAGNRKKIDRYLKTMKGIDQVHRIKMDIRHVYLPGLPTLHASSSNTSASTNHVVLIAKHLCGVASDFAIKSAFPLANSSTKHQEGFARCGLAIATCCHHACQFEDYVGKDWLASQGLSRHDFEQMKSWSGWATSHARNETGAESDDSSSEEVESAESSDNKKNYQATRESAFANCAQGSNRGVQHSPAAELALSHSEMSEVGWQCKRIIDYGRIQYIEKVLGMSVRYTKYCERELSPECMVILAKNYS